MRALVLLTLGPRVVGGQRVQVGDTVEAPLPVLQLVLLSAAGQPFALPCGIVAILHGERRQRGAFVQSDQFFDQDAHRPTVGCDVVHIEQQDVVVRIHLHQRCAQHQVARQVERPRVFRSHSRLQRLACGQAHALQREPGMGTHFAHRLAFVRDVHRAQDCMPLDDGIEGMLERVAVEHAFDPQRRRYVISRARIAHAVDQPQPLLGVRQRMGVLCARENGRRLQRLAQFALAQKGDQRVALLPDQRRDFRGHAAGRASRRQFPIGQAYLNAHGVEPINQGNFLVH
ncbi:hypothetical protein D3C81_1222220 [compost metagenome]